MMELLKTQQWVVIAIVFFGIMVYIVTIRRRDRKWIETRFGGDTILAVSFGVNYFGQATAPGTPKQSSGFLLLLRDRLFYRSRLKKIELEIPAKSIKRVYHGRQFKGAEMHQSLVKVDFINEKREKDTAAFKVPYPPQWIRAIENNLLKS